MIVDGKEFRPVDRYGDRAEWDFRKPKMRPEWRTLKTGMQAKPRRDGFPNAGAYAELCIDADRAVERGEFDQRIFIPTDQVGVIVGGLTPRIVAQLKMSGVPKSVEYVIPVMFPGHPVAYFSPDDIEVVP